jgi:hypothetical protein
MPKLGLGLGLEYGGGLVSASPPPPPTPIPPNGIVGLNLWLKSDAGVTVSGGRVTVWQDQTASIQNLTAYGTGPLFVSSDANVNGYPTVLFSPGTGLLSPTSAPTQKTIYAVVSSPSVLSAFSCILEISGGGLYTAIAGNRWGSYFNGISESNDTIPPAGGIIASLSADGIVCQFRRNGQIVRDGSFGGGFFPRSQTAVGGAYTGYPPLQQSANIPLAELIAYNRRITEQEVAGLELYLNQKYQMY